ncbi:MAG TPA: hypothetical protein VND64_34000 [Pirellulales bacterium]|nr:hypothetical protein [Pirellulales bacterium]
MKKGNLPPGWTEKDVRALAARHDTQTEGEVEAEIEAVLSKENQTLMVVPTELVPEIHKLLCRKRTA